MRYTQGAVLSLGGLPLQAGFCAHGSNVAEQPSTSKLPEARPLLHTQCAHAAAFTVGGNKVDSDTSNYALQHQWVDWGQISR